jgi:hypothetical protein
MACCGQNRRQFQAARSDPRAHGKPASTAGAGPPHPDASVFLQYVGQTNLVAIGGFTGMRYRFSGPGARVAVDARDLSSLAAVPNLKLG